MIATLWAKLQVWAVIALAVVAAIAVAFLKGRSAASEHIAAQSAKANARVQAKYDNIDQQPSDPDAAAERLRRRAR